MSNRDMITKLAYEFENNVRIDPTEDEREFIERCFGELDINLNIEGLFPNQVKALYKKYIEIQ